MKEVIRWGIIATGNIANKFATFFPRVKNAELMGVGSRKMETAKKFAHKYNLPKSYGSYQELVEDPDIDAVYIATPHHLHRENTLMALNSGKSVLCEKPFAINAQEAREMIEAVREKKLFLMEAMWMRFNPAIVRLRDLLKEKRIGQIASIKADFGFWAPFSPEHRLFNPALGGGALLDVGVYPVSLAHMILGCPETIKSTAFKGKTGVDEQNAILFQYPQGEIAQLSSGLRADTDHEAFIAGTEGSIRLHRAWHRSLRITLRIRGKSEEVIDLPEDSFGLNYETQHMTDCMREGKTESDIMPPDESLAVIKTMDKIRSQWGLYYPMESK